jgi:hypothetical protein
MHGCKIEAKANCSGQSLAGANLTGANLDRARMHLENATSVVVAAEVVGLPAVALVRHPAASHKAIAPASPSVACRVRARRGRCRS